MTDITVSDHAMKRLRKRLGIPKKTTYKMARRAFNSGLRHQDVRGNFKRYLDSLFLKDRTANNIRVYGNYVYLFGGTTLITVFTLPLKYRKYQKKGL